MRTQPSEISRRKRKRKEQQTITAASLEEAWRSLRSPQPPVSGSTSGSTIRLQIWKNL